MLRWAIYTRKHDTALILWEYTESPLISSLGATGIYESIIISLSTNDQRRFLASCKKDFESLAIEMLATIYNRREDLAATVLKDTKHESWENICPLSLALKASDQRFVAVPVVQQLITKVWVGEEKLKKKYVRVEDKLFGERSPRFKFYLYYILYFPFLILYSFFTLFVMDHDRFDNGLAIIIDFVIFLFVLSLLMRRIVDLIITKLILKQGKAISLESMAHFWYLFGTATVVIHVVGFVIRLFGGQAADPIYQPSASGSNETRSSSDPLEQIKIGSSAILSSANTFTTGAKTLYCIAIYCFWFQVWELLVLIPRLGPYIYLIGGMLSHFFSFLIILIVVMFGYVVASQSIIFPQRDFEWLVVRDLLYYPYFQLYGELFLTETTGAGGDEISGCVDKVVRTKEGIWCPQHNALATVFLGIYLMLGIIMLVNLLIAVFR